MYVWRWNIILLPTWTETISKGSFIHKLREQDFEWFWILTPTLPWLFMFTTIRKHFFEIFDPYLPPGCSRSLWMPPKYTDIACFLTIVTETDLYLWGQKISHLSLFFLYFCNIKANSALFEKNVNSTLNWKKVWMVKKLASPLHTMSMTTNNLSKCLYGCSFKRKCKLDSR